MQIDTDRLTLASLQAQHAQDLYEGINDWSVMQWLRPPPWPYRLEDAQSFIARAPSELRPRLGLFLKGEPTLLGIVSITGETAELGYWLRQSAWGQGYMSEAARALTNWHFEQGQGCDLVSGNFAGNIGSERIQQKLGFTYVGEKTRWSVPMQKDTLGPETVLTRQAWHAHRDQT